MIFWSWVSGLPEHLVGRFPKNLIEKAPLYLASAYVRRQTCLAWYGMPDPELSSVHPLMHNCPATVASPRKRKAFDDMSRALCDLVADNDEDHPHPDLYAPTSLSKCP